MIISSPRFNPTLLSGLGIWYDPADSASVAVSTGASTIYDKSGNGVHQTQATGSKQPTYSNTINGNRVLTFDGSDDETAASANAAANFSSMTVFCVFQSLDTRNGGVISKAAVSISPNGWGLYTRTPAAVWFQGDDSDSSFGSVLTSTASPSIAVAYGTGGNQWLAVNTAVPKIGSVLSSHSANLPVRLGVRRASTEYWYGHLCEFIAYNRMLTGFERSMVLRYLQHKWAVTPTFTTDTYNLEAQDWIDRAYANSGTVSVPQAAIASELCDDISTASLRDRFYRFNPLIGDQLAAALTPWFRGPVFGGQVYGNATDTGVNLVNGDYSLTVGITGNESTKYFRSGAMTAVKPTWDTVCYGLDVSASAYTGTQRYHCGSFFNESPTSPRGRYTMYGATSARTSFAGIQSRPSHTASAGLKLTDRASSTALRVYENGVQVGTTNTTSDTSSVVPASDFCVMASGYQNVSGGTPTTVVNGYTPIAGSCRGYLVAETMTPTQHSDFYALWAAFKSSIGRS